MKKLSILALVVCLLAVMLSSGLAQARSELTIIDSSAEAEFPASLAFNLSVESDSTITDIRLHYVVDRESFAQVTSEVYLEFEPGAAVDAEWDWDMRKTGGLPPGSSVNYWWTVTDAAGNQMETAPMKVSFDDLRYSWRSLAEGGITIYWYQGDDSFAGEVMAAAQQALARLTSDTGASLERSIRIYLYANTRDLQGAMINPQEWTGGAAFTRYDIITIGIAPSSLQWGRRALAHELTHLVIHQMTLNPYGDLPTWLDEGLAMYTEGALSPQFATYLDEAVAENELISVRSLASPFSAYAEAAILAYAQSYSIIEFLIGDYGQDKMLELLNIFREGSGYDAALEKAYGFDMDGLNALWRDYLDEQYAQPPGRRPALTSAGQ